MIIVNPVAAGVLTNETLKQYQGEVLQKAKLQAAFTAKVLACKNDSEAFSAADWSGLTSILQTVFHAFE
jgi:hypothetical protein